MTSKQFTAQLSNIDDIELLTIAQVCIERLGCVTPNDYSSIMAEPRRTVYDRMSKKRIKYLKISNSQFPCINVQG